MVLGERGNIFDISGFRSVNEEVLETLIKTPGLLVERIVSHGQTTVIGEWYDQAGDEWVLLLTGRAVIRFESDETIELLPGDYLFIPAHRKHRVEFTSADPDCIWLAIHGKL